MSLVCSLSRLSIGPIQQNKAFALFCDTKPTGFLIFGARNDSFMAVAAKVNQSGLKKNQIVATNILQLVLLMVKLINLVLSMQNSGADWGIDKM